MDQKVTEIRYEQWRRTVSECINRKAGISKRQWCDENGIRYRSLMYWQRKFQQEAIERMSPSRAGCTGLYPCVCRCDGKIRSNDRTAGNLTTSHR